MDPREELIRLYTTYNPKRLKDVDALLERFKGREHVILKSLREKYAKSGPASAASSANPSYLYTHVSPVAGSSNEASMSSAVGSLQAAAAAGVAAPGQLRARATSADDSVALSVSTTMPPPPPPAPSPPSQGRVATEVSPPAQQASASGVLSEAEKYDNSCSLTSAARQAEMRDLLRQMTSLDVAQLASRVEEMVRSAALVTSGGSAAEGSRIPRLQWRREQREATSMPHLAPSVSGGQDSMAAVLQHTSVFLAFFARCARRYVALAEAEQQHWETQQRTSKLEEMQQQKDVAQSGALSREIVKENTTVASSSAENNRGSGFGTPFHDSSPTKKATLRNPDASHTSPSFFLSPSPPPLPSPPPALPTKRSRRSVTSSSSCVRNIRRASSDAAAASPLSMDGVHHNAGGGDGSPPACRTTTVSPLTSPDDHSSSSSTPEQASRRGGERSATASPPSAVPHDGWRSRTHSPPSPPQAPAPQYRAEEGRGDHQSGSSSDVRLRDSFSFSSASPPPPLPLVPPPPQPFSAGSLALMPPETTKAKRVLHWAPVLGLQSRYSPLCNTLESGDCIVLQPGVYYENLRLRDCGRVELTSAYPGAAVVLRPFSDLEPVLSVAGAGTQVRLTGVVLVQGEVSSDASSIGKEGEAAGGATLPAAPRDTPAVALLAIHDGAEVTATACHFYGGTGGGIVAAGRHTRLRLDLCLISLCHFAGVYVHGGASTDITQSKIKKSEVGMRVLQGSFFVSETTFEDNRSDGLVVYEESMGVLERSNVFNNSGNGVFLSSGTEVRVLASTIELNGLYGVQRARGSTLHVKSSFIRDNGLLPINEETD